MKIINENEHKEALKSTSMRLIQKQDLKKRLQNLLLMLMLLKHRLRSVRKLSLLRQIKILILFRKKLPRPMMKPVRQQTGLVQKPRVIQKNFMPFRQPLFLRQNSLRNVMPMYLKRPLQKLSVMKMQLMKNIMP